MHSDIKSTQTNISATISGANVPGRIKAVWFVAGATAGTVVLRDGGASGAVVCTINTPALGTSTGYLELPGSGIRCETDIYATIINASFVTVFYA